MQWIGVTIFELILIRNIVGGAALPGLLYGPVCLIRSLQLTSFGKGRTADFEGLRITKRVAGWRL